MVGSTQTPGRGRPRSTDPLQLQTIAMQMIDERGYNATTLADVARTAGVSIRTVHRYFGTKRDLVWYSIDVGFSVLRDELAAGDPGATEMQIISDAVVKEMRLGYDDERSRVQMKLIATVPELSEAASEPFQRWPSNIADYVQERLGGEVDPFLPFLIGRQVRSAAMAAMSWWASHEETTHPADIAQLALEALAPGLQARIDLARGVAPAGHGPLSALTRRLRRTE